MAYYHILNSSFSIIISRQNRTKSDMNQTISEFGFLATPEKTSLIYKKLREELDEAKFLRMFSEYVNNNAY